MTTKRKVIFQTNVNQGHKTKLLTIHPIKKWIGMINQNNTFSLWNYQQKILIKSFNCNTLDDSIVATQKNANNHQIKQIVFFDKYSLCTQSSNLTNMKNNIIFVTPTKLFFYDYITDVIKQLTQKEFQQKNIRKVCVYSHDTICLAMSDGSFKVLDCQHIYTKDSMTVRTIRGFHHKPITWIFSYAQNQNDMPRVITASAQDGAMACWNVDMILKSSLTQNATPCFKFTVNNKLKGKDTSSNQQLLSLQYDPSSYRLMTLSHQWIKLWSTMTGMQVRRIKNTGSKSLSALFFSHFSYPPESFIIYSNTSKINIVRSINNNIQLSDQIELKTLFQGAANFSQPLTIRKVKSSPYHPAHLFIITNYNTSIVQLDKFFHPPYGTSPLFLTQFSTINSKQFITNKMQQQIRKDIKHGQIAKIKFQQDILLNTFYLSVDQQWIYFNLVEIQCSTMLHESRKYKMYRLSDMSPLTNMEGGRSSIIVNYNGQQIIIFNKALDFYEIFEAIDPFLHAGSYEDLLNKTQKQDRIDFYSKFRQLGSGYCRQIIWHQFKNEFAIIAGIDQNNKLIEMKVSKQKKGIFRQKQAELRVQRSGIPVRFCICIYHFVEGQYRMIQRTEPILSKNYKLYNFGSLYGYSMAKSNHVDIVQFVSGQKNMIKQIQGVLHAPQSVYVSYCESCYILSYQKFFIVYKMQENGSLIYVRTLEHTILHGYFWEKLFFFLTQTSLYFLHIINNDTIVIKIADVSNYSPIQIPLEIINIQDDDFQPDCKLLPPGNLQIAGLINMNIMLLNQNSIVTLISLQNFPYIVFCLEVASQITQKCNLLIQRASPNIRKYMKQMIYNYGLVMHVPHQ